MNWNFNLIIGARFSHTRFRRFYSVIHELCLALWKCLQKEIAVRRLTSVNLLKISLPGNVQRKKNRIISFLWWLDFLVIFVDCFQACVYLFTGLSVHLWHPTYKNMDCIRSWLLKADLSSPEHQLARYVVSNLNWGHVGEVRWKLLAHCDKQTRS